MEQRLYLTLPLLNFDIKMGNLFVREKIGDRARTHIAGAIKTTLPVQGEKRKKDMHLSKLLQPGYDLRLGFRIPLLIITLDQTINAVRDPFDFHYVQVEQQQHRL